MRRAVLAGDLLDDRDEVLDLGAAAVELDDQQRLDVQRIAGLHEGLGGPDGRPVHHLHAAGNDAGGDDVGDALPGLLARRKADQQSPGGLGLLQDAHRHLGDDTEQALRARHQAEEVIALAVEMPAADADHVAVHQHHLEPSTLFVVRPYLRQCTPPEFSATLPPIEQAICEDGSGA